MKIRIDFSVITRDGQAIGNVEGQLDFEVLPEIGDTISFLFAPNETLPPRDSSCIGSMRVADRIFRPCLKSGAVILMLGDLMASTKERAIELMRYF